MTAFFLKLLWVSGLCSVAISYSWLTEFDTTVKSAFSLQETLQSKVVADVTPKKFRIVESAKKAALDHFVKAKRAQHSLEHDGYFYIRVQDEELLSRKLHEVSDPYSPTYAQYLTSDEIAEMAFDENSHYHVETYLQRQGFTVHPYKEGSGIIHVSAPVNLWETALNTEFFEYQPREEATKDVRVVRAESYSLPDELMHHVSFVLNIVSFPLPSEISRALIPKRTKAAPAPAAVDLTAKKFVKGYVTPALINQVYDVRNNTGSRFASQGVYETIDQTYSPSDLTVFQRFFGLPTEKVAKVIGGHANNNACLKDHGNDCVEANLDVQYLMAVGQHIPTMYYYWSGEDFMLAWLNAVVSMAKPPQIFSISYGADENYITTSYATSFNQVAMRLGLMGVTLVASSGDDGAVSTSARSSPLHCGYAPSFPASSPYVVAVGGTMGPEDGKPEVACQGDTGGIITTGGGFSTLYPTPSWQSAFTTQYWQTVQQQAAAASPSSPVPVPGYTASGRGIPDISLLAHNYVIAVAGNFTAVSGTSASSPVFAGMLGLINSARHDRGLNPVGWVLPALYAFANEYVRDITEGHNRCTADGLVCCAQGFYATTGWDPVTGLGSLNFTAFQERMVSMGALTPTLSPTLIPGSPTKRPTKAPVSRPTTQPTAPPVKHNGYLRVLEYTDTDCAGSVTTVSGAATGVCLPEYDADGNVVGALKYACEANGAVLTSYSSATCKATDVLQTATFGYGCAYRVATDYYATDFYSVAIDCVEGTTAAAVLGGLDGRYALQKSFDSTTGCDAGKESSVLAVLQGHCFPVEDRGFSYRVSFPTVNYYQSLDCSGRVAQTETLNDACLAIDTDGGSSGSSSSGSSSGSAASSTSWRRRRTMSKHDAVVARQQQLLHHNGPTAPHEARGERGHHGEHGDHGEHGGHGDHGGGHHHQPPPPPPATEYASYYEGLEDGDAAYGSDASGISSSGSSSAMSSSASASSASSSVSSLYTSSLSSSSASAASSSSASQSSASSGSGSALSSASAASSSGSSGRRLAGVARAIDLTSSSDKEVAYSYSDGEDATVDLFAVWSDHTVHDASPVAPPTVAPSPRPSPRPSVAPTSMPTPSPTDVPQPTPIGATGRPTSAPVDTTSRPSPAPTSLRPTTAPSWPLTLAPTLTDGDTTNTLVVVVSQVVQGTSKSLWTACGVACRSVWQQAISDVFAPGLVPASDVSVVIIRDVLVPSSSAAAAVTGGLRSAPAAAEVEAAAVSAGFAVMLNVTYVLAARPTRWALATKQEVFHSVRSCLHSAVIDGGFDHSLRYRAAAAQVGTLMPVTTTPTVMIVPTSDTEIAQTIHRLHPHNDNDDASSSSDEEDSSSSSSSSSSTSSNSSPHAHGLGAGQIGSLIVGLIAGVVFVVVACLCWRRSDKLPTSLLAVGQSRGGPGTGSSAGSGTGGGRRKSTAYVQLPVGGDSAHGLRMTSADDGDVDGDNDIEVVEFSSSSTGGGRASSPSAPSPSSSSSSVTNPVFFRSSMIQQQDHSV